jgi:septum formation protein
MKSIILASRSKIRKKILEKNNIKCKIAPSNIDENSIKESLIKEKVTPKIISKNLAESKGKLISKPTNRGEAFNILRKLNGRKHQLISSVCISKNGSMIWNHSDKASLTMKKMNNEELKTYLNKIKDENLYAYNVYQIEGEGRKLFSKIDGDEDTIMGLPVKKIKEYLTILND